MSGIIALRKGDALQVRVEFTRQSDNAEYPMTGWTLEADMRYANCTSVALTCSWIAEASGIGLLFLDDETTLELTVGDYELQVRATSPEGNPTSPDPIIIRVRD